MIKDPSKKKVAGTVVISAIGTAPTTSTSGFDVSAFSSILISVHPTAPNLATVPVGFAGIFRLWRFKAEARLGQGAGSGQWYSDEDVTIALDGTGQMEIIATTDDSTKMFLQLVSVVNSPANFEIGITPYQLVRRKPDGSDMVTAVVSGSSSSDAATGESTPVVIPTGLSVTSTDDTEHWTAAWSAGTDIIVSDTATGLLFPVIDARQIVAVVQYDVTANMVPVYYYRHNTQIQYELATGTITIADAVFDIADDFVIYWEDSKQAIGSPGQIPHTDAALMSFVNQGGGIAHNLLPTAVDNGDVVAFIADLYGKQMIAGYTLASDSNRVEEVDPLNEKALEDAGVDTTNLAAATHYYPSVAGASMQGYKDLSFTGYINDADGIITLSVWGTNDDAPAATDWVDVSLSGYRTDLGVVPPGTIPTVTNVALTFGWDFDNFNYKYYRFGVVNNGATNTVIVKPRRKAL